MNTRDGVKIVSSRQFETGNVPHATFLEIREENENPKFDPDSKPYKFVEKIKTNTRNHGWLFEIDDNYYMALQHQVYGASECISIYASDKKQNWNVSQIPLKRYVSYVDVEYIVDKFVREELGIEFNKEEN